MIKAKSRLDFKFNLAQIDFSHELARGAQIVAEEIRGNIKREEGDFVANADSTANQKARKGLSPTPLIAEHKSLVSGSSYVISTDRKSAKVSLTDATHPSGNASVADIGLWNHQGTNRIPARPFFVITETAKRRVMAMVADKIARAVRGG